MIGEQYLGWFLAESSNVRKLTGGRHCCGWYLRALFGSLPVRLPCSLSQICLLGPKADCRKFPSDILRGPAIGGIPGLCKALPRKGQRSGAHRLGEDGIWETT